MPKELARESCSNRPMEPAAVLFTIGRSRIGLCLGRTSIGSPFGAAGSLVVLTVWVFYPSMIVFFGAELTYIRSSRTRRGLGSTGGRVGATVDRLWELGPLQR